MKFIFSRDFFSFRLQFSFDGMHQHDFRFTSTPTGARRAPERKRWGVGVGSRAPTSMEDGMGEAVGGGAGREGGSRRRGAARATASGEGATSAAAMSGEDQAEVKAQ